MPMPSNEIKAELVRACVKQSSIARETGFSQPYVSDIIAGNRRNEKVERAVARAIGREVHEVFAEREAAVA